MNHLFLKIPLILFAASLLVLGTLAGGAAAQTPDQPKKEEIQALKQAIKELTKKTSTMTEMFSEEATGDLTEQAKKLKALLDLDEMEDEVAGLFEMDNKEKRTVRGILQDFQDHWIDGDSCICSSEEDDEEWFEDLLDEAQDELNSKKADRFTDWLNTRKAEVERVEAKLKKAAERFGEEAGRWAEEYADEFAEQAEAMEEWAEDWGEEWEDWAEEWAEDWEDEWADWADELAEEIACYSEEYAEEYAELADQIGEDIEYKLQELLEDAELLKIDELAGLKEEDFEELGEEIGRIVEEAIGDMDWDELGEDIREATEEIVPDVEDFHLYFNFNDETFEDDIQKYTDKIHDAAEILRKAVDRKREKLNAHHSNFQRSLQESLSELGLKLERLGRMDDEKDEESSEGAKEQFERAARLRDREAARAFRKRMELERILEEGDEKPQQELLHELQQQQEEIKVRDETLHSLKKEIKMLKEEIKQMKQEQKSRREETENSEEIKPAQSGRQVCEVSIHP